MDKENLFEGLRVEHVADSPEKYQHAQNLPVILPNSDFQGLRVVVHTLPTATREGMAKLGKPNG